LVLFRLSVPEVSTSSLRESLVEFLHIGIIHIISLRRQVYNSNAIEVSRNQFLAEEKGVIHAFRQVMVAGMPNSRA